MGPAIDRAVETAGDAAIAGQRWLEARLSPTELATLTQQGFVAYHRLPSGTRCAKLRFRDATGGQQVRYLGVDLQLAHQVSAALQELQRTVHRRRESKKITRGGWRLLRDTKRRLNPHLRRVGWHFHGLAPRRCRTRADAAQEPCTTHPPDLKALIMNDEPRDDSSRPDESQEQVQRRLFDNLRRGALEQPDPADAAVRYMAAQLMEQSTIIGNTVTESLRQASDCLAVLDDLSPHLEMMLKLCRQSDRYLNIAVRRRVAVDFVAKISQSDTYADYGGRRPESLSPDNVAMAKAALAKSPPPDTPEKPSTGANRPR